MSNTKKETKNPPVAKIRVGSVTASIWENKTEKSTFSNVTFESRFKNGNQWKTSYSYSFWDLLDLAKAADLAHTRIIEAMKASAEARAPLPAPEADGPYIDDQGHFNNPG